MEEVSTTCGRGWVDDQHAILLMILIRMADPPATAGGTDHFSSPVQVLAIDILSAVATEPGVKFESVVGRAKPQKNANTKSNGVPKPGLLSISTARPASAVNSA